MAIAKATNLWLLPAFLVRNCVWNIKFQIAIFHKFFLKSAIFKRKMIKKTKLNVTSQWAEKWHKMVATNGVEKLKRIGLSFVCIFKLVYTLPLISGEMIFLLWGIKVCFNVRKARTYFDEAKLISYSIYNITIVNVFMAVLQWVQTI